MLLVETNRGIVGMLEGTETETKNCPVIGEYVEVYFSINTGSETHSVIRHECQVYTRDQIIQRFRDTVFTDVDPEDNERELHGLLNKLLLFEDPKLAHKMRRIKVW